VSNKRNQRRRRQRIRSEANRKPGKVTKGMEAFIQAQSAERERKAEAKRRETMLRADDSRWRYTGKTKRRRKEYRDQSPKPRRVYGNTYYTHSLDN
jgi:hypothetical protein